MAATSIDLNADLGEGAPHDAALLEVVTSASVACGFHAGDPESMMRTAAAATRRGVVIGAHPSYFDRDGFGRRPLEQARQQIVAAVAYQVGAMVAVAAAAGAKLRFVKPHGALYNRASLDAEAAEAVVEGVAVAGGRTLALLAQAGSELARRGSAAGLATYGEGFADRRYAPDGFLVDRSRRGSVIEDPDQVVRQALDLVVDGRVTAEDGRPLEVRADSICVHGDTPGAAELAGLVRRALEDAGVVVAPFT